MKSFDTLMQESYRIVQGKNGRVQAFVLHLEWDLKTIKQQHPHAMTEQNGEHHLKDHLFHGLRSNIWNALHNMYNKPNSQYSKLVMAARKNEIEFDLDQMKDKVVVMKKIVVPAFQNIISERVHKSYQTSERCSCVGVTIP